MIQKHWRSIFNWRTFACCFWSLFVTCLIEFGYVLIFQFSIFSPVTSVLKVFGDLLEVGRLFCLFLLVLSSLSAVLGHCLVYRVSLPVYAKRLDHLREVLSRRYLLFIVISALCDACAAVSLWALSPAGRGRLFIPCDSGVPHIEPTLCVSGHLVLLVTFGFIMGLYVAVDHLASKRNYMMFPLVQQPKIFKIKEKFKEDVISGAVTYLKAVRLALPLTILTCSLFVPHISSQGCQWSVAMVIHLLFIGIILCIARRIVWKLFCVFHTQSVQFPVNATYSREKTILLHQALGGGNPNLLRYLAFQDLHNLALQSPERRQEVFSLSPTGGSINWERIYSECSQVIREFTSQFVTDPPSEPLPQPLTPAPAGSPVRRHITDVMDSPLGMTHHDVAWEKAKLWSQSPREVKVVHPAPKKKSPIAVWSESVGSVRNRIHGWTAKMKSTLGEKKVIAYFLKELPESKDATPFKNFQLIVWCVEGVSQLAVCSYSEDKYGVVQKDLSAMISSLIALSKVLDSIVKTPIPLSSTRHDTVSDLESNAKHALKAAVLLALHKLRQTFGSAVRLPPQDMRYLVCLK